MNTYSGKTAKVFTINQNECSRSTRIGVHDQPESVFMMGQNTQRVLFHLNGTQQSSLIVPNGVLPQSSNTNNFTLCRVSNNNGNNGGYGAQFWADELRILARPMSTSEQTAISNN